VAVGGGGATRGGARAPRTDLGFDLPNRFIWYESDQAALAASVSLRTAPSLLGVVPSPSQ